MTLTHAEIMDLADRLWEADSAEAESLLESQCEVDLATLKVMDSLWEADNEEAKKLGSNFSLGL